MSLVDGPIFQICCVVDDVESAERYFTEKLGVARWLRHLYTEQLESAGPGVHHVAWVPDDFEATLAEAGRRGLPVVQRGRFEGVGMEFAYRRLRGTRLRGTDETVRRDAGDVRLARPDTSGRDGSGRVILATHYTLSLANSTELGHWRP